MNEVLKKLDEMLGEAITFDEEKIKEAAEYALRQFGNKDVARAIFENRVELAVYSKILEILMDMGW